MSTETHHTWLDDFFVKTCQWYKGKNCPYNENYLICSSVINSIYHGSLIPHAAIAAPLGWH